MKIYSNNSEIFVDRIVGAYDSIIIFTQLFGEQSRQIQMPKKSSIMFLIFILKYDNNHNVDTMEIILQT